MRLTELDPRWVGFNLSWWNEEGQIVKIGLTFRCPHCGERLIGAMFKPYIDPSNFAPKISWAMPDAPDPNTGVVKNISWWTRNGESFDDLTLTPSINLDGHWHGFITNGDVT